jgi:hypothetical protein
VRSAGLRNKPIDRRRLTMRDRSDYNNSGAYGNASQALSRARQYRGRQAYMQNKAPNTQDRTPGSGSFGPRDRRVEGMPKFEGVPEMKMPSAKGDLFEKA